MVVCQVRIGRLHRDRALFVDQLKELRLHLNDFIPVVVVVIRTVNLIRDARRIDLCLLLLFLLLVRHRDLDGLVVRHDHVRSSLHHRT